MALQVSFTLTKDELIDYNLFVLWSDPQKKNVRMKFHFNLFVYMCLCLLLAMSIFGSLRNDLNSVQEISISILITIIFVAVFGGTIAKMNLRKTVENLFADPRNENILLHTELIISPSGIENNDEVSHCVYSLQAILRREETNKAIYLFLNSAIATVIPKRILRTVEMEALTKLLNENIMFRADVRTLADA